MTLVTLFLIACLVVFRHVKGPVWALALAWLFCLAPIEFGWITYDFFDPRDLRYAVTTIALLGVYVAGAALWLSLPRAALRPVPEPLATRLFVHGWTAARAAWWIGMIGAGCVLADFVIGGGAGLDDLAALRDAVVGRTSASLLAQIGSVLTWGCLYCFIFAIVFRTSLRRAEFVRMLLPIAGYFLLSVVSAGRQAAFQIMLVTILSLALVRARRRDTRGSRSRSGAIAALAVAALMTAYMGYVAVARNDNVVADDKATVITTLFDATLGPRTDAVLASAGPGVHSAAVEGMVYFSSPIALFQKYLEVPFPQPSYGAMTFPFAFRQIQGLTGLAPSVLLNDKMDRLDNAGVIGAGWTTALSAFLEDFGPIGTAIFLFVLGYSSQGAWCRARVTADPHEVVMAMVGLLVAVYLPLLAAMSDTNILLLWIFAAGLIVLRRSAAPERVAA